MSLRDRYITYQLDNMDSDSIYQLAYDLLLDGYSDSSDDDLRDEIVENYDEQTLRDLDSTPQKTLYDEVVEYYSHPNSYIK
jgi:hypothetical protein